MPLSLGFIRYAKNTGYLLFEKIARMIFMLTVWAYVARYLGPEQFGLFNYALSFIFLFNVLADLGLESIVVRELVRDGGREGNILGSAFVLKFCGGIVAAVLIFFTTKILSVEWQTRVLILAMSARLIFYSFKVVDFYFQSKVLSKYTVYSSLFSLAVTSVLCLIFIRFKFPLIYFIYAVVIEIGAMSLALCFYYLAVCGKKTLWRIDLAEISTLLRNSWPLMFSIAAAALYMRIDQVMIKDMLGSVALGYYSSAVRISEAFYFIPMILTSSLFPAIVNAKIKDHGLYAERMKKLFSILFWTAFLIAVAVTLTAKFLVGVLYGQQYLSAVQVLTVHVWVSIFAFLGVGVSKWMINENLQVYFMIYTAIGAAVNILLNFLLIPRYGIVGSAFATVISQFVVVIVLNPLSRKTREVFRLQMSAFKLKHLSLAHMK